jgi:hypothetical protein
MAYRVLEVKVTKVDPGASTLIIKRTKQKLSKPHYLKTVFKVDRLAVITGKDNRSLKLADIKVGDKINLDFMKTQERKLLAKGITVLN